MRRRARERGIRILGDIPIYVAMDSADVWAHPELFALDADRRPVKVAGVPPDYFSQTGQLWGNPLYDWDRMAKDGFAWWTARIRASLSTCDLLRIDHFRARRCVDVAINPCDRFAFAKNVCDVALARSDNFAIFD